MKYAMPLVEGSADSRLYVLDWVEPEKTVLEFGCAYGQMTQYMKEKKNCKVYIIEYDREMYDHAAQFAEDGVCGDILQFEWLERFKDVRFDYILFTDVLEHLQNPLLTVKNAVSLLKEDGKVLLSFPNAAHCDIICKLLLGRFDYTPEGLLDETHIHLFTAETMKEILDASGLKAAEWKYTYADIGETEQKLRGEFAATLPKALYDYMDERGEGYVYQYLVKAEKNRETAVPWEWQERKSQENLHFDGHLYLNCGEGYQEKQRLKIPCRYVSPYLYEADVTLELPDGVKGMRLDPLEGKSCDLIRMQLDRVEDDQTERTLYTLPEPLFLLGPDPYLEVPADWEGVKKLRIRLELEVQNDGCYEREINALRQKRTGLEREKSDLKALISSLEREKIDLKVQISRLESEKIVWDEEKAEMLSKCRSDAEQAEQIGKAKERLEKDYQQAQQQIQNILNSRTYRILQRIKRGLGR